MARWQPSPFRDWDPDRLKAEIEKTQEERQELFRESSKIRNKLNANKNKLRDLQFMLICNSGLRDSLREWKGEGS